MFWYVHSVAFFNSRICKERVGYFYFYWKVCGGDNIYVNMSQLVWLISGIARHTMPFSASQITYSILHTGIASNFLPAQQRKLNTMNVSLLALQQCSPFIIWISTWNMICALSGWYILAVIFLLFNNMLSKTKNIPWVTQLRKTVELFEVVTIIEVGVHFKKEKIACDTFYIVVTIHILTTTVLYLHLFQCVPKWVSTPNS